MLNLLNYFRKGLKNTLLFRNNFAASHNGPNIPLYDNIILDKWHIGDFGSAEYAISVDLDSDNREILKVLVTASLDNASIVIYARNYTVRELVSISASVNKSYVELSMSPAESELTPNPNKGAKVIYQVNYYQSQNSIVI